MKDENNAELIFNKYAEKYQEKYMDLNIYAKTLDLFLEQLPVKNARILDVGCGPGNISSYLLKQQHSLKITGLDVAEKMVNLARKNVPNAKFRVYDVRNIGRFSGFYDGIIAGFYLPYLSQSEALNFIRNCSKLLKNSGILYLSFMEDAYANSGFVSSSSNPDDKLFTYYHESDHLVTEFDHHDLKVLKKFQIKNPNNREDLKDVVLVVQKVKV